MSFLMRAYFSPYHKYHVLSRACEIKKDSKWRPCLMFSTLSLTMPTECGLNLQLWSDVSCSLISYTTQQYFFFLIVPPLRISLLLSTTFHMLRSFKVRLKCHFICLFPRYPMSCLSCGKSSLLSLHLCFSLFVPSWHLPHAFLYYGFLYMSYNLLIKCELLKD